MKQRIMVLTLVLSIVLACSQPSVQLATPSSNTPLNPANAYPSSAATAFEPESMTGILNPVTIEFGGRPSGPTVYGIGRTDVASSVNGEAWLPAGAPGNLRSIQCDGGFFLVGPGGQADFSSPSGTISLWIKWDETAPQGRFWGQHNDFETRWSVRRLTLDWGGDTTLRGYKDDWTGDHWYFLAITWNETSNRLVIFWGDESTTPTVDVETDSWTRSVVGLHTENNIMSSRGMSTARVLGHIDDFRYYDRERTLEEIQSDYRNPLTIFEPHLVHYYKFEDDLSDAVNSENLVASGSYQYSPDVFSGESGWAAHEVTIDVRDLKWLYALNGTFEDGNPGMNVDWSGDGQYYPYGWRARRDILFTQGYQRAGFVMTGNGHVTIENQGYEVDSPDGFRHYDGTRIFWYQDVANIGSVDEFILTFNYLYLHGPIGDNFSGIFEFCVEILDGSEVLWAWSSDPTNLTERGSWMAVGPIMVNLPHAPPVFELRVSLKVNTPGSYVEIPVDDSDLGGDVTNGQFVSFLLDDVSLTATGMTSCDSVELTASNEIAGEVQITGSEGAGSVSLSFNYWNVAKIPVQITANTTVSFEFSAAVTRMARFSNSTSSTSLGDQGVSFNVNANEAVEVWLFTYLESYPEAADLEITVKHPADWSANSVRNSFGNDVTASCVFETGNIKVPSGVAGSAGWWRFDLSAPNYMDDVWTQVQRDSEHSWQETSLFRNNDRIRCIASLGMETGPIEYPVEMEINIYLPSGTLWKSEVVSPLNSSTVACTPATLGSVNSSIGIWAVTAGWDNGTGVAYGSSVFEVHHRTTVFPHTPSIQVEIGNEFTAAVYIYDQDTGSPILAGAEVIGNLSSASIVFSPNLARSWWEATFNTSDLTNGEYVIQVNVSIPFYETFPCFISLSIPMADSGFAVAFGAGVAAALAIFAMLLSMTYGRRLYMSVVAKRNLRLLEMKGRIDDAKNLIGLLVIHKKIGLPVYSKVLKGAFEESVLSSFISAISHFRDEFSMSEPKWKSIPITEVITAVQTDQLICAIITVDPSSDRTRRRLEEFGRSIGSLYDSSDEMSSPRSFASKNLQSVTAVVDPLFEGYFDGGLTAKYVGLRRSIPSRLKPVSEAFSSMKINHGISPESVIRSIVLLGYSERTAYRSVLEAVDEGYLIRAKNGLPLPKAVEDRSMMTSGRKD